MEYESFRGTNWIRLGRGPGGIPWYYYNNTWYMGHAKYQAWGYLVIL